MNHAKIAAALHALADAFLADVEAVEQTVTGKKGSKKAAAAAAETTATVANVPATEPAPVAAAVAPAPTVTKAELNALVLKVAAKNRDTAKGILAKFGQENTVTLPQEQWQAVYDAFEEEIAKIDAAAVQVAQASLV
jgi:hypothetical protein